MLIMLQTYKYINTWGIMNTLKSILLNLQRVDKVDKAKKKKIYRGRQSRQKLSVQGTQFCRLCRPNTEMSKTQHYIICKCAICRLCQPVDQLPSNIRHILIYLILFANNKFIICRPFNLSTCEVKLSTCRPCRLVYIFYKFFLHLHYSSSEYSKTLDIAN